MLCHGQGVESSCYVTGRLKPVMSFKSVLRHSRPIWYSALALRRSHPVTNSCIVRGLASDLREGEAAPCRAAIQPVYPAIARKSGSILLGQSCLRQPDTNRLISKKG